MINLKDKLEKKQIEKLTAKKSIPNFRAGDTIKVNVRVSEGERSRIQSFEGICIARKNNGINSSFTVRKFSHGEGVERIFPLFSPSVESINVIRQGDVNRAKLYYLRKRSGKGARIVGKDRGVETNQYEASDLTSSNTEDKEVKKEQENPSSKEKQLVENKSEKNESVDNSENKEDKKSEEKDEPK